MTADIDAAQVWDARLRDLIAAADALGAGTGDPCAVADALTAVNLLAAQREQRVLEHVATDLDAYGKHLERVGAVQYGHGYQDAAGRVRRHAKRREGGQR